MLPEEEQAFVQTKQSLLELITGLLGGRVAEEFTFNEISTGAHNDLQRATQIARAMITEYGMSENLGPVTYEHDTGAVFLGRDYGKDKNFSEAIATEIDKEIRGIIHTCYGIAQKIIAENKELLDKIAHYLLEVETLTREDIDEILKTGRLSRWDDILVSTPETPTSATPSETPGNDTPDPKEKSSAKNPTKESA
jgi:cell division protease FtsH